MDKALHDAHLLNTMRKPTNKDKQRALLSTQNMGKGLHKLSKAVFNEISQVLPISDESGSEVSYFITKPRNFVEVTRCSEDIKKP